MIQELDSITVSFCVGGRGECHCMGTDSPDEKMFGVYRKMTATLEECINWCLHEKHGTKYKYYDNPSWFFLGWGQSWKDIPKMT